MTSGAQLAVKTTECQPGDLGLDDAISSKAKTQCYEIGIRVRELVQGREGSLNVMWWEAH